MRPAPILIGAFFLLTVVPLLHNWAAGESKDVAASGDYFGPREAAESAPQKDGRFNEKGDEFRQGSETKKEGGKNGRNAKGAETRGASADSNSSPIILFGPKKHAPF